MSFEPNYSPCALNTATCIQQGDLFILRAYTGTGVSHSQRRKKKQKKNGRGFEKNEGEWTGKVEIRKKFLAVSVACMSMY